MTARLITLSLLVALVGCDSSDPDDIGSFAAEVSGDLSLELEGDAAFATQTEDGQTVTAVGLIDEDDPEDVIVLVMPGQARTGTFQVNDEQAGGLFTESTGSEGTLYIFESGRITISEASTGELEGTFEVRAVSLVDDEDVVDIEGEFDAERGQVDTDL